MGTGRSTVQNAWGGSGCERQFRRVGDLVLPLQPRAGGARHVSVHGHADTIMVQFAFGIAECQLFHFGPRRHSRYRRICAAATRRVALDGQYIRGLLVCPVALGCLDPEGAIDPQSGLSRDVGSELHPGLVIAAK